MCFSPSLYRHCKDTVREENSKQRGSRPTLTWSSSDKEKKHRSNFVSTLGITLFNDKYAS